MRSRLPEGEVDASTFDPMQEPVVPRLLAVRQPLSPRATFLVGLLAFAVPFLLWSALSYVPFLWHPLMLVKNPGDTTVTGTYAYLAEGQLVERDVFAARNGELTRAKKPLATGERSNPVYFQPPHAVARALYTAFTTAPESVGDVWFHQSLLQSCKVIFWGFFWSALFGIPIGVACGTFAFFSRLFEPFVDFVRYMPAPVFGALAVSIFGLAEEPKIAIIFVGTFFQMVLVVANTTRTVELSLLQAAQTLGAKNWQLVRHVVLPGMLPALYRDVRILIGWAWTYLVVAELIGEKTGLSAFIYQQQRYRHFDNVYAAIVIIGLVGLGVDQLLAFLGRYLFPWESGNLRLVRFARGLRRAMPSARPVRV